jgi:hypothetical protein
MEFFSSEYKTLDDVYFVFDELKQHLAGFTVDERRGGVLDRCGKPVNWILILRGLMALDNLPEIAQPHESQEQVFRDTLELMVELARRMPVSDMMLADMDRFYELLDVARSACMFYVF